MSLFRGTEKGLETSTFGEFHSRPDEAALGVCRVQSHRGHFLDVAKPAKALLPSR